jgi:low affinity Fe/Cu permease
MSDVQQAFKNNRARQNVIVAGGLIMVCITLLSCVSSFMIYREGFGDTPWFVQQSLSLFAVIVVEGAFVWLVYGFTRAFSSFVERLVSLVGMAFLVLVMLTNIITHFMMVKHLTLSPFQNAWLSWGAVSVFIAVLVIVLLITLADPVGRLMRQELRVDGKQQEVILHAKGESLDSDYIQLAMLERAEIEAMELAERIVNKPQRVSRGTATRLNQPQHQAAFRVGKDQRR